MDITDPAIDGGRAFDFGRTSADYARFRDIYPAELYNTLAGHGIGISGQNVLDLGTGTAVLPRNMQGFGAKWTGLDISAEQLAQAKRLKTYTLTALVCVLFAVNGLRLAAGIGTGRQHVDLILYVAFVLTGYLLRDRIFGRRSMKQTEGGYLSKVKAVLVVLTVVSAAAFLATYGSDGFQNAFAVRGLDIWWYYSPFITLTAVLLFAVLVAAPAGAGARTVSPDEDRERAGTSVLSRRARVLVFLSENSFGVYLVHIAVIRVCFRAAFFTDTARTSIGTAALAAVGTLLISYTVSAVCGKIPGIRCLFLKKSLPKS